MASEESWGAMGMSDGVPLVEVVVVDRWSSVVVTAVVDAVAGDDEESCGGGWGSFGSRSNTDALGGRSPNDGVGTSPNIVSNLDRSCAGEATGAPSKNSWRSGSVLAGSVSSISTSSSGVAATAGLLRKGSGVATAANAAAVAFLFPFSATAAAAAAAVVAAADALSLPPPGWVMALRAATKNGRCLGAAAAAASNTCRICVANGGK